MSKEVGTPVLPVLWKIIVPVAVISLTCWEKHPYYRVIYRFYFLQHQPILEELQIHALIRGRRGFWRRPRPSSVEMV